jgi:hypothetical protein
MLTERVPYVLAILFKVRVLMNPTVKDAIRTWTRCDSFCE